MAAMCTAALKWNKAKLDVDIDPNASVAELKARICKLTGVPVDRQKLSCPKAWKGNLADDTDLKTCALKDGMVIMLIGTADVMSAKTVDVVFVEDMKEEDQASDLLWGRALCAEQRGLHYAPGSGDRPR